jgi:hypothetical protein
VQNEYRLLGLVESQKGTDHVHFHTTHTLIELDLKVDRKDSYNTPLKKDKKRISKYFELGQKLRIFSTQSKLYKFCDLDRD